MKRDTHEKTKTRRDIRKLTKLNSSLHATAVSSTLLNANTAEVMSGYYSDKSVLIIAYFPDFKSHFFFFSNPG